MWDISRRAPRKFTARKCGAVAIEADLRRQASRLSPSSARPLGHVQNNRLFPNMPDIAGQLRQQRRDLAVPALGGMLITHRGRRRGVPQAGHQLGQAGTGRRGQHRTGVPQVMETQIGPARCVAGRIPVPV